MKSWKFEYHHNGVMGAYVLRMPHEQELKPKT